MAEEAEHASGLVGGKEVGVGVLSGIIFIGCFVRRSEGFGGKVIEIGGRGNLEGEGAVGPAYYTGIGLEDGGVDGGFADADGSGSSCVGGCH